MSIGIIGAGALGSNLARLFAKSGIEVTIANNTGPASLAELVNELGPTIKAGAADEAARADIVIVAIRWADLDKALSALPAWNGRIVVDATNALSFLAPDSPDRKDPANPFAAYGLKPVDLGGKYSSAVFRTFVPGARLVKTFNTVGAPLLAEPRVAGGQRVMVYSGDDAEAKAEIRKLIERTGYFPIDLGALDVGGPLASSPFGPFASANLVKV